MTTLARTGLPGPRRFRAALAFIRALAVTDENRALRGLTARSQHARSACNFAARDP